MGPQSLYITALLSYSTISRLSRSEFHYEPRRSKRHSQLISSDFSLLASCFLFLASLLSLSCNQPFQPVINYTPKLVMYSILFANESGVYVRLSPTTNSINGDVTQPVHGANVGLVIPSYLFNPSDSTFTTSSDTISLKESYTVSFGDTDYYYYSPMFISSGGQYGITAQKEGYEPASAYVTVPSSFVTIPNSESYSTLRYPDSSNVNPYFSVALSGSAAYFVQLLIEYRGFDYAGNFQSGHVDATGITQTDPFNEVTSGSVPFAVNRLYYASRLAYAKQLASNLKQSHLYADIVVTQVNDPLYRFYLTSGRWTNPLAMRTDKAILSNVTNGDGIVGAAAVDTTRIYLF